MVFIREDTQTSIRKLQTGPRSDEILEVLCTSLVFGVQCVKEGHVRRLEVPEMRHLYVENWQLLFLFLASHNARQRSHDSDVCVAIPFILAGLSQGITQLVESVMSAGGSARAFNHWTVVVVRRRRRSLEREILSDPEEERIRLTLRDEAVTMSNALY